jgi:Subtilase family
LLRKSLLVALLVASCAAPSAVAGGQKHRPAGMPETGGASFQRRLMATFAAERVIVAVRTSPVAASHLRANGATVLSRRAGIWLLRGPIAARVATWLEARGLLRYVQPDRAAGRNGWYGEGEPLSTLPWWVPAVGADEVQPPPGPGVPISVIDDGIDVTHPELAGRPETRLLNAQIRGVEHVHGTMVSSVAAAPLNGQGIAGLYPQARLRSYDVGLIRCSDVVAGTDAAIDADETSVLNYSLGFADARDCPALYDAVAVAFGSGHLVVASAGNDGRTRENFPASYPHVLTVAASDPNDETSGFSTRNLGIDLAAPGESIPAAVPFNVDPSGYMLVDGTSFSAPLVSAAAAWAWTARASEIGDVTQLFELVRLSSRDIGEDGWDAESGFGVLDLPSLLTDSIPDADRSEPNDDIDQVVANGLFAQATPPLLARGKKRGTVRATLDWTEDPVDVYRVWVPGRRSVSLRLTTDADVDLELFRPSAKTVYYTNHRRALRGPLIGGSYRSGRSTETFVVSNGGRGGVYVFACAFKARNGSFLDATYTLRATVTR